MTSDENKETRVARAIYECLNHADDLPRTAYVGSGNDLAQVSIDGMFNLLSLARTVISIL
jgi:hypothetical protein